MVEQVCGLLRRQSIRLCVQSFLLLIICLLLWPARVALADTFTVTDSGDSNVAPTLRKAILDANGHAGSDIISFNLGAGVHTIQPTSPLPAISDAVEINALGGDPCS